MEAVAGTFALASGSLEIAPEGARFNFTGSGFHWLSGSVVGSGSLTNDGVIQLESSGSKTLSADSLVNTGSFAQNTGWLTLSNTVFDNVGDYVSSAGVTMNTSTLLNRGTALIQCRQLVHDCEHNCKHRLT